MRGEDVAGGVDAGPPEHDITTRTIATAMPATPPRPHPPGRGCGSVRRSSVASRPTSLSWVQR
jgi:hypothetical protein